MMLVREMSFTFIQICMALSFYFYGLDLLNLISNEKYFLINHSAHESQFTLSKKMLTLLKHVTFT